MSNFRYADIEFYVCKYDVFKMAHIQIRFLEKDPVFKYVFLVLFSHPCIVGKYIFLPKSDILLFIMGCSVVVLFLSFCSMVPFKEPWFGYSFEA